MRTAEYIQLEEEHGAHNYLPLDVVLARGEGVWVYDIDGNRYLDCLSAYSAVSQGHVHPRILAALHEQAQKLTLTSRAFRNDQLPLFYKELSELTGYDMSLPMNSGAEAVETGIKLARKWAYTVKGVPLNEAQIVAFDGNFHGRTTTIVSFSSESQYRHFFGPYDEQGFVNVAYGDPEALAKAITPNTAAVLIEPIQGESGIRVPPEGFLRQVRQLCSDNGVLMIADEIQTGLGRTGKLFAVDHEGVRPDMILLGKALSGGFYPVSAVIADRPLMGLFVPGDHGSTFGGNPLAAAVSRAAIRVLTEEGMIENSAAMGRRLMAGLKAMNSPRVKEIRGKGLLIGVELTPEAGPARPYCELLAKRGILIKETHGNILRLAPPLVIESSVVDWALEEIAAVL